MCRLFGFHNHNLESYLCHSLFGYNANLGTFLTIDAYFFFLYFPLYTINVFIQNLPDIKNAYSTRKYYTSLHQDSAFQDHVIVQNNIVNSYYIYIYYILYSYYIYTVHSRAGMNNYKWVSMQIRVSCLHNLQEQQKQSLILLSTLLK